MSARDTGPPRSQTGPRIDPDAPSGPPRGYRRCQHLAKQPLGRLVVWLHIGHGRDEEAEELLHIVQRGDLGLGVSMQRNPGEQAMDVRLGQRDLQVSRRRLTAQRVAGTEQLMNAFKVFRRRGLVEAALRLHQLGRHRQLGRAGRCRGCHTAPPSALDARPPAESPAIRQETGREGVSSLKGRALFMAHPGSDREGRHVQ